MTRARLAGTIAAVAFNLAAGLVLLRTLETVALPAIIGLLRYYGAFG